MKRQNFSHRPPTIGIHLLSDPPPPRIASTRAESQNLTSPKQASAQPKIKKAGLRN